MGKLASPLRVMHLVAAFRPGGMEHGVVKIVNGLPAHSIGSSICSTLPADQELRDTVRSDVPVIELARGKGNDPRIVWAIYRTLRRHRPHVLHTHAWGTLIEGLAAARLARVPVVVHGEHGTLQLRSRQVMAQRWAWRRADHLLSVSSRLAERMSRDVGIPLERIRVIRNGVNLTRFGVSRTDARIALGIPNDGEVIIGAVGRLVDVKDHSSIIDAAGELRARGRRVRVVIAGDGPLAGELETRIVQRGLQDTVRLLGHRSDVETVFGALDIFVQSSKSEGMSNTILEAMASGLPIVSTHVGGADEMVIDGRTGVLIPPGDAGVLAAALDRLVLSASEREAMGAEGQRRARAEFSIDAMIRGYEALYQSVMHRTPGSVRQEVAVR